MIEDRGKIRFVTLDGRRSGAARPLLPGGGQGNLPSRKATPRQAAHPVLRHGPDARLVFEVEAPRNEWTLREASQDPRGNSSKTWRKKANKWLDGSRFLANDEKDAN
jgi:hypothetical protein